MERNPNAFPCVCNGDKETSSYLQEGMTLLDYFASSIMKSLIEKYGSKDIGICVEEEYKGANLMLNEREKYL